jgi:hypothetical protein
MMPPILHAQQDDNRVMYSTIGAYVLHSMVKQLLDALQHGAPALLKAIGGEGLGHEFDIAIVFPEVFEQGPGPHRAFRALTDLFLLGLPLSANHL